MKLKTDMQKSLIHKENSMKNYYAGLTALFVCVTIGCSGSESYSPSVDSNSFDYRYSKTRMKMEGYSDKDSDTAARAIMMFNEAQKNRKR